MDSQQLQLFKTAFLNNQKSMEGALTVLKARANPVPVNKITLEVLDELEILLKVNKQIFLDLVEASDDATKPV